MSSMKLIKQRIANVSTTKQIMKAMDMVATSRLQKARLRLYGIRPLYSEIKDIIDDVKTSEDARDHIYVRPRKVKKSAYVVITSDKGLCGSYNTNICQAALEHMSNGKNEEIFVIGSKGSEYFRRRNKKVKRKIAAISEARIYFDAGRMCELLSPLYISGEIDEIFIAYTHFESTLSYIPRVEKVLPLFDEGDVLKFCKTNYEPNVRQFIDNIIPLYLQTYFFAASSEAVACEHASRMVNMESASKNATEIIDDLKRMYNRKRQAMITQELNEIIGGASILR